MQVDIWTLTVNDGNRKSPLTLSFGSEAECYTALREECDPEGEHADTPDEELAGALMAVEFAIEPHVVNAKPAAATKNGRQFALTQYLRELDGLASALRGRANRLDEFRDIIKAEVEMSGIDAFLDSSFLTNATREALDSTRLNAQGNLALAVQFAATVQFGRP